MIDKKMVGTAFHDCAGEYDRHTPVQQRVVTELLRRVRVAVPEAPETILDIGCGTGRFLSTLGEMYPGSRLHGLDLAFNMARMTYDRLGGKEAIINGDAACLPYRDNVFDLVVSTSTLQWLDDLDSFFRECHRILQPDGMIFLAFFGGRTLCEFHECYRDALLKLGYDSGSHASRLHRFRSAADVEQALARAGLFGATVSSGTDVARYVNVTELLRSIKRVGAGTPSATGTGGGLGWRRLLNETSRLYHQKYGMDGMITATYETLYIEATGAANR